MKKRTGIKSYFNIYKGPTSEKLNMRYYNYITSDYNADIYSVVSNAYSIALLKKTSEDMSVIEDDLLKKQLSRFIEDFKSYTDDQDITKIIDNWLNNTPKEEQYDHMLLEDNISVQLKQIQVVYKLIKPDKIVLASGGYNKHIIKLENTKTQEKAFFFSSSL